jgi:hypothetical protein
MLRKVASKVAWVGRTASMVFGLALVLALIIGMASMALAANGGNFILGQTNVATALTILGGSAGADGPMLRIANNNADPNDTALELRVQSGEAPMTVNRDTKVANLNADKLDGLDSSDLQVGCPTGTTFFGGGGCVEDADRGQATFASASSTCAGVGRRLLTSAELDAFRQQPGVDIGVTPPNTPEWTGTISSGTTAIVMTDAGNSFENVRTNATPSFRCVTAPSN